MRDISSPSSSRKRGAQSMLDHRFVRHLYTKDVRSGWRLLLSSIQMLELVITASRLSGSHVRRLAVLSFGYLIWVSCFRPYSSLVVNTVYYQHAEPNMKYTSIAKMVPRCRVLLKTYVAVARHSQR